MIILGLGSNYGNRQAFLQKACKALETVLTDMSISACYETPALLPPNAPADWDLPFINQAVRGETSLTPPLLLAAIKDIEKALGRIERGRWGPREMDIDILAYQEEVLESVGLTIPHPGLLERAFALLPLAEIAPAWRYPVPGAEYGKTARELAERFKRAQP
jgi:2-amino-4-hydroxy-6-hydroxymethyldihydropteridine diphosphokinase